LYCTSTDGVNWGPHTQFLQVTTSETSGDYLSPSLEYWDGEWWLWAYRRLSTIVCRLRKAPSIDGPWSDPVVCNLSISAAPRQLWHFDVIRIPNGWAHLIGDRFGSQNHHWLSYSKDGRNWETPKLLANTAPTTYRSTFVRNGAGFDCWIGDWDARTIRRSRLDDAQV